MGRVMCRVMAAREGGHAGGAGAAPGLARALVGPGVDLAVQGGGNGAHPIHLSTAWVKTRPRCS